MSAAANSEQELINPIYHAALLRDVDSVVRSANIPVQMLYRSMRGLCTQSEIDYVKGMRRHASQGIYGLVLNGVKPQTSPLERFSAMAAACLRNYIAARVMTLQDVIEALGENAVPYCSVLLIPNFFAAPKDGGTLAKWQTPELLGLLYSRQSAGLQTVVYTQSLDAISDVYGHNCAQHLRGEHFIKVETSEPIVK